MTLDPALSDADDVYVRYAKRWVIQLVGVSIALAVVNLLVVVALPPGIVVGLLLFFLNVIGMLACAFLLFRHIDTLVLERIDQYNAEL